MHPKNRCSDRLCFECGLLHWEIAIIRSESCLDHKKKTDISLVHILIFDRIMDRSFSK
uniref:Uncharacterized protein n=1 Tax=Arundo donax TaxID=35708 RepID=A0A0A9G4F4_ARUDO